MADWFGISHVICSLDTVDCYNSKVLQATMGAIFRVSVSYVELNDFFNKNTKPVYGALLEGENLFNTNFKSEGIILLGNEGNGIRQINKKHINFPITIPKFGEAESLNVATAGAIILGSLFRGI
jgi:TrmH family RNA methyltransferase